MLFIHRRARAGAASFPENPDHPFAPFSRGLRNWRSGRAMLRSAVERRV